MIRVAILSILLMCSTTCWAGQGMGPGPGITVGSTPSGSFVGSPGALEGFEGPGITLPEFSETDPDGVITCSSTTAALSGTYGCLFSNGSSAPLTNYIKADLGALNDGSFSLTWTIKTPVQSGIYNNYQIFRSREDDAPAGTGTADSSLIVFDNDGTATCRIILYSYYGSSGDYMDSSASLSYNTVYKLTLKRTTNTVDGLILEIRNSSDTLVDTLVVDATAKTARYIYWFDQQTGNDYYIDDIRYDDTNP